MLSSTSQYAFRALAGLTQLGSEEAVLARTLAETVGVPFLYLSKILGALSKAGILHAGRGPKGGYRLARPADEIILIDIVEMFDGIKARPACFFGGEDRKCSDDDPCSAHEAWKEIREGYIEFLESKTIADIAGPALVDGAPAPVTPPGKDRN
jgi:Rrf2 family protein